MMLPPGKPTFFVSIEALRLDVRDTFAHIFPTPEELDAADALEIVHQHHDTEADHEGSDGRWGTCTGCADPWPCKTWLWGDQLATQWIGRAHDRYSRSIRGLLPVSTDVGPLPAPTLGSSVDVIVTAEQRRLAKLHATPVTPVYCRHPDCHVTVSIPHPLTTGYLHRAVCPAHTGTTADRYQYLTEVDW